MATIYVRPGEGRHYTMIDGDHVAKAAVEDACGAFEVFEVIAQAAPVAPPHVSPWTGVLFLLEGRITAVVGGTPYDVEPGGVVVFPAGTSATFGVIGESARFVAVTSGDGAGRFFADFASSVPVGQPDEDSMEAILSVTRRHSVALAGALSRARAWPRQSTLGDLLASRPQRQSRSRRGRKPEHHQPGRQTAVAPKGLTLLLEQGPIMTELKASPRRAFRTMRLAAVAGGLVTALLGTPAIAATPPPQPLYLALGDSVAVGVGAQPPATEGYVPGLHDLLAAEVPCGDGEARDADWTSSTSLCPGRRRPLCSPANSPRPSA